MVIPHRIVERRSDGTLFETSPPVSPPADSGRRDVRRAIEKYVRRAPVKRLPKNTRKRSQRRAMRRNAQLKEATLRRRQALARAIARYGVCAPRSIRALIECAVMVLGPELRRMYEKYLRGDWVPAAPKKFIKRPRPWDLADPRRGKGREVHEFALMDHLLMGVVLQDLERTCRAKFTSICVGGMRGRRGSARWIVRRIQTSALVFTSLFWAITDIRKFFDSIPHDRLEEVLRLYLPEEHVRGVMGILRGLGDGRGIWPGSPLATFLGNVFAHHVIDHAVPDRDDVLVIRFIDDILVIATTKEAASTITNLIRDQIRAAGLEVHPEKSSEIIHEGTPIPYLGVLISRSKIDIPKEAADRLKRMEKTDPEAAEAARRYYKATLTEDEYHSSLGGTDPREENERRQRGKARPPSGWKPSSPPPSNCSFPSTGILEHSEQRVCHRRTSGLARRRMASDSVEPWVTGVISPFDDGSAASFIWRYLDEIGGRVAFLALDDLDPLCDYPRITALLGNLSFDPQDDQGRNWRSLLSRVSKGEFDAVVVDLILAAPVSDERLCGWSYGEALCALSEAFQQADLPLRPTIIWKHWAKGLGSTATPPYGHSLRDHSDEVFYVTESQPPRLVGEHDHESACPDGHEPAIPENGELG